MCGIEELGTYMFSIVVLLICTLAIRSSVLCVFMVKCMSVVVNVMLSLTSVMSPPPVLCDLLWVVKLCTLVDDICMCFVHKQFELLEFAFNSFYVDLKYNNNYLTFTVGCV